MERGHRHLPLADIDGDRRADLVIWRPGSGTWYWLTAASGHAYALADGRQFGSGVQGDTPLARGDFDGDGTSDLAVFRTPPDNRAPLQWFWTFSSARFTDIHGRPWP
jgi:VCBS repeat protein